MGLSRTDAIASLNAIRAGGMADLDAVLRMFIDAAVPLASTDAAFSVSEAGHQGRDVILNRAAGQAVTLPPATGSGLKLRFIVLTTITSNSTTIKVTGDDTMIGNALIAQDGGDTGVFFEAGATADTITFNGTTTGGVRGAVVTLTDIAADVWFVDLRSAATGTEATPFSATVS